MTGLQKSGYLEVKQPSNIKGRKLKAWRKKWVVAHKMSNLSSGTFAAKMDLYPDEESAKSMAHDKQTFIFENVTEIKAAHSKTHKMAFEILETEPVLVLSGQNQLETESWMSIFQNIFWPREDIEGEDSFKVFVIESNDSTKNSLYGQYYMTVSPQRVKVKAVSRSHEMEWNLGSLKRFYVDRENSSALIIESGAKSDCGEAKFKFSSMNVHDILKSIRNNISIAIAKRQKPSESERDRSASTSDSEKGFKVLLENSDRPRSSTLSDSSVVVTEPGENTATQPESRHRKVSMVLPPYVPPKLCKDASTSSIESNGKLIETESENEGSNVKENEYSVLNQSISEYESRKISKPVIISSVTVYDRSQKNAVFIDYDTKGYSHIPAAKSDNNVCDKTSSNQSHPPSPRSLAQKDSCPDVTENETKVRSVSGYSTKSEDFHRSSSVSSRDSGVVCASPDVKPDTGEPLGGINAECKQHSSNSFDSAISTSSTISASVKEAYIVTSASYPSNSENQNHTVIPVSTHNQNHTVIPVSTHNQNHTVIPVSTHNQESLTAHEIYYDIDHTRKTSRQHNKIESHYEELDKYKKDINKFLGIEPKVKPSDIPPSLPERPSSLPLRRREQSAHNTKVKQNKKISLPLLMIKTKSKKSRSPKLRSFSVTPPSSSSPSSSDVEDEVKSETKVANVKHWPLEKNSKSSENILYETVKNPFCEEEVRARSGSGSFGLRPITKPRRHSDSTILDNAVKYGTYSSSKGDAIYSELKQEKIEMNKTTNTSTDKTCEPAQTDEEEVLIPGLESPVSVQNPSEHNMIQNLSSNSICDSNSSKISGHSTTSIPSNLNEKNSSESEHSSNKSSESLIEFDQEIDLFHIGFSPQDSMSPKVTKSDIEPFSADLDVIWNPFPELGQVKPIQEFPDTKNGASLSENRTNIVRQGQISELTNNEIFDPFNLGIDALTVNTPTPKKNLSDHCEGSLDVLNPKLIDLSDDNEPYMDMKNLSPSEKVEYVEADLIRLG